MADLLQVVAHPWVTRLLLTWTLTIVFLPFPTALLPAAGDQSVTRILHIGTILLSTLLLGALTCVVIANPQLADGLGVPSLRTVAITYCSSWSRRSTGSSTVSARCATPDGRPSAASGASRTNPRRSPWRITCMRHRCRID